MAHGRVQTPAATSPPVLTGFPVSGCCYLDRPDPAGYFLFPDLSVRHEGRYRLVFSLYELIKDAKDLDRDAEIPSTGESQLPADACHRMDLRSADFTVYSAKKFPGLTESTTLSRVVAEQGCRVRIRRDVRMRRRDPNGKSAGGEEHARNPEDEFANRRGTNTPDYRGRSGSISSMERSAFNERRPSNSEFGGAPTTVPSYQSSKPPNALLNFGHNNSFAQPTFGHGNTSNPQSTPVSPAQTMYPPNQGVNMLPPSPCFSQSSYQHEEADQRLRGTISSFPPQSSKPFGSMDSRSSMSSNMPTRLPRFPAILPAPSPSFPMDQNMGSGRLSTYSQTENRSMKRLADPSFPPHQHGRSIHGERLPNVDDANSALLMPYNKSMTYKRATGDTVQKHWTHQD